MATKEYKIVKGPPLHELYHALEVGRTDRRSVTFTVEDDNRRELVFGVIVNGLRRSFETSDTSWEFEGRLFGTTRETPVYGTYSRNPDMDRRGYIKIEEIAMSPLTVPSRVA